ARLDQRPDSLPAAAIALAPCFVTAGQPLLTLFGDGGCQNTCGIFLEAVGGDEEAAPDQAIAEFAIEPALWRARDLAPPADERLVRDIDLGVVVDRLCPVRPKEGGSLGAEAIDDRTQLVGCGAGHCTELGEALRSPDRIAFGFGVDQRAEQALDPFLLGRLVWGCGDCHNPVSMNGEQPSEAAGRKVILVLQRLVVPLVLPKLQQPVLDERQSILLTARLHDQSRRQFPADVSLVELRWLANGAEQRGLVHLRQEVLGPIDRFGETGKAGTLAEIIG